MADRRMFTKKVTDDDNFMLLSSSAQALYLHLAMSADDDGFSNQVSISMYKAHASVQDLEALLEKRYIYQFDNGVIVVTHWRMANALRKDRYTPSIFQSELAKLQLKENGTYTFKDAGNQLATSWQPNGNQLATQDSIGKDRVGKDRIDKDKTKSASSALAELDLSDDLKEALRSFIEMRKGMKKPVSDRALQLLVKKLNDMASDERTQIAIVNQSIMNSWLSLYPLKIEQRVGKNGVKLADNNDHELDEVFGLGSSWSE